MSKPEFDPDMTEISADIQVGGSIRVKLVAVVVPPIVPDPPTKPTNPGKGKGKKK